MIRREYGFDHLPTEGESVELSDRWRPYRSLPVTWLTLTPYTMARKVDSCVFSLLVRVEAVNGTAASDQMPAYG